MAEVPPMPRVDCRIEVMCTKDISLIKDPVSLIFEQRTMLSPITIPLHFKGPSILAEYVDMGEQKTKFEMFIVGEGGTTTTAPASNSTFEPIETSVVPLSIHLLF